MSKLKLYTNGNLDQLRERTDPPADQAVLALIDDPKLIREINEWTEIPEVFKETFSDTLISFFRLFQIPPNKSEIVTLQKGQEFFDRKGDIYLGMLGFYSLPYCYAFAKGAEVLVRSKRILAEPGKRLGETAKFLLDVFKPGAFIESKEAFLICAKIRLIHAFSRYFIKKYSKDWKNGFGQPVNQEDLIGTNLAFSLLVLRGMRKIGKNPNTEESNTVLAYWSYLGKLMGIETHYWPETAKEAFELEKLIRKRHLQSSEAGKRLIDSLVKYYEANQTENFLKGKSASLVAFLIGKEASDALGIHQEIPMSSELMGGIFSFLGWKNYAGKKSHARFNANFEQSYFQTFESKPEILLPER